MEGKLLKFRIKVKATERNRTADLIITSELLYHLSYGGVREIKKAYSI